MALNNIKNNINLPTTSFDKIFHVGTLDITKKVKLNFEGTNGLSVSTEPDAWRKINSGMTGGETFSLSKQGSSFIDYHAIPKELFDLIYQWGADNGLLTPCVKYEFSYFCDEYNRTLTYSFFTHEEAEEEVEEADYEIKEVDSFKGTEKFASIVGDTNIDSIDLIIVAYCILMTEHDGVYWHDNLDVLSHSAPRGVIIQNKLNTWDIYDAQDTPFCLSHS